LGNRILKAVFFPEQSQHIIALWENLTRFFLDRVWVSNQSLLLCSWNSALRREWGV